MNTNKIREENWNIPIFNQNILAWITSENLWNLWVPKEYNGREESLVSGLKILKELAKIDGSLGWTVTLCSGANYFISNLEEETRNTLFLNHSPILGGSGGAFGVAKKKGNDYLLNGIWKYATGSHYLTHFTLNAKIIENGVELRNKDNTPKILSFVLPKEKVKIIEDWNTMGLQATITHSFLVENIIVNQKNSFTYSTHYLPQTIFKIPFATFADLTLWANYIGMAEAFLEETKKITETKELENECDLAINQLLQTAESIENNINKNKEINDTQIQFIHELAAKSVRNLSLALSKIYPYTGIKGATFTHKINHIFRDFYTGTQHKNFFNPPSFHQK